MSARSVLVTGGAGFIGSHVAARFARDGYRVRVLDDLSSGSRSNLAPEWELVEADVCAPDSALRAVDGCDVVVHLAAFTSVPESFERHRECYRINALGTHRVADACVRGGVRKLVFASSSAVYAELPDAPKHEDDCPEPISPYGVSKLGGEHLLEGFQAIHGLGSVALRFFNVYGPRQPGDSAYAAAVPIFMERGLRGETLIVYGDGRQTRDFVYVEDVAEAVYCAAQSPKSGVFNVGTAHPVEILELAHTIAKLTGGRSDQRFEPLRPGDVRSSTADISRIVAAFDWQPAWSLERGLAATLAWYREKADVPVPR